MGKKPFMSETAVTPPGQAGAVAASQEEAAVAAAADASDVDLAPVSQKGLVHPAPSGQGTVGKKVMIRPNHAVDYFLLLSVGKVSINSGFLNELINVHEEIFLGDKSLVYDGGKSLYTTVLLSFADELVVSMVERAEGECTIIIRIAGRTDLYHLQQFLRGRLIYLVDEQGTRKIVVLYFREIYYDRLKYASWPCLQSGSDSHPVYVLMEVCKIVEGQRYPKLNDRQVIRMLEATCKRPQERDQNICIVGGRNTVLEGTLVCKGTPFVPEVSAITFVASATPPPQPGEDSASSIAVYLQWIAQRYTSLVFAQPHRHEIIEDLFTVNKDPQKRHNVNGGMIRELLIPFRRKTNRRPERIFFHRDGTSEDQLSRVLLHELDTTNKVRASLEDVYLPPVTSVVVQKSHHLCSDDHYVCSVSVGPASYDAHVAMFCEHGYVDAESSDNGSAIGNTEQTAQEGSVEVRQLPEMRHTSKVKRKQMSYVSVVVQMLGTVIPVSIN